MSIARTKICTFLVVTVVISPLVALAQPPQMNSAGSSMEQQHAEHLADAVNQPLAEQIDTLRRRVSELESKVRDNGVDPAAMAANGSKYRQQMSMGGVANAQQFQAIQPAAPAAPMAMMTGMMSMMNNMMGGMSGAAPMGQSAGMGVNGAVSTLPGFPGYSHLYHIGATNFFLDHPEHITLSLEQQSRLGEVRMRAALRQTEIQQKIQMAEEQLWFLTAVDQPNFALIEAKVRESENLQGNLRLALIKDVGEAASLLTDDQRRSLLGQLPQLGGSASSPSGGAQSNSAVGGM